MKKELIVIGAILAMLICCLSGCLQQFPTNANHPSSPDAIRYEDVVWVANHSIANESDVRNLFDLYGMQFWNVTFNFLRSHNLFVSYLGNYKPLFDQMGIKFTNLTSVNPLNTSQKWGPSQWIVDVPATMGNLSWRIGNDGYIEEKHEPENRWYDVGYVWFLIEQQNGTVRVIC